MLNVLSVLAERNLSDNQKEVTLGVLARIEAVQAASEVARRREDLIVAQARAHDQQEQLKTAISKQVHSELAAAEIVADRLPEPSLMIFSRSKRRSGWRLPPRINHVHPMAYRKAPFYSRRARRAGPRTPDMPSVTARP